jgi:GxxExxY protein
MNTDKLKFQEEIQQIIGASFEVLNALGHGFFEKVYEKALSREFTVRSIPYKSQESFKIIYKEELVGEYIPDLIAFDRIIIELKTIEKITDHERGQALNYLKVTGREAALILNFKRAKLEWEKLVLTNSRNIRVHPCESVVKIL